MAEPTPTNKRKAKRHSIDHDCMIYSMKGEVIAPCGLRNISGTGAQIELRQEKELPQRFILTLSFGGEVRRWCELVWQFSTVAGIKFFAVDPPADGPDR